MLAILKYMVITHKAQNFLAPVLDNPPWQGK